MQAPDRRQMSIQEGRLLLQRLAELRLSEASISDSGCLAAEFGMVWGEKGQVSLHIESRWRASRRHSIITGSSVKSGTAARQFGKLIDLHIEHIDIGIDVHDLTVSLTDDHRICSFHDGPGHPQWGLAINDANLLRGTVDLPDNAQPWLGIRGGKVELEFTFDDDDLLILEG